MHSFCPLDPTGKFEFMINLITNRELTTAIDYMNIYLVGKTKNPEYLCKYGRYGSFVVRCDTEDEARKTHPSGILYTGYVDEKECWNYGTTFVGTKNERGCWVRGCDIWSLDVTLIGTSVSQTPGIILASYDTA